MDRWSTSEGGIKICAQGSQVWPNAHLTDEKEREIKVQINKQTDRIHKEEIFVCMNELWIHSEAAAC
jgi:hypothetical protein